MSTTYDCLLETSGFKFRQCGITDDPAKAYNFPTPVIFRDSATMKFYRFADETKALVEIAPAYRVLCGSIAIYYADETVQKRKAREDNGRIMKPQMKPISSIRPR